jgi:hypothetical protein
MAQITGGAHRGHAAGDNDIEKAASQLASDTKYKVKKRMGANVSRMAPAAVTKAYLAQLAKSPAPGPVKSLAQKKLTGGLKEEYDIDSLASDTIANAMFKVFVEGIQEEPQPEPEIELSYLNKLLEDTDAKKYKIVVTDKKTGNQYRRMATREKIAELRANPNIQSVELSSYGEPIGSEKKSGEQTAKVKSGKGLDYDGDGKVESGAKEHAGAVHNAIQRKKGGTPDGKDTSNVKEAVEAPVAPTKRPTKGQNDAEIVSNEEKGMDNTKLINVFPELKLKENAYGKFLEMIQEKTLTTAETKKKEEIAKALKPKYGKTSKTYAIATSVAKKVAEETESDTEKRDDEKEVDPRSIPTKINLLKNKLRSAGIKSPVFMMTAEETVDEARASEKRGLGSPEVSRSFPGRKVQKERGEAGGRHWQSGGEGGSNNERGVPGAQASRLRGSEPSGKYIKMQTKKRDLGSGFD